jgi:hypothetical protein
MLRPLAILLAPALLLAPSLLSGAEPPAAPPAAKLDAEQSAALACAATFAVVASEQARGVKSAYAWPPLRARGREYFVRIGARTMDQSGATREQVRAWLEADVAELQQRAKASGDPDAVLAAAVRPCLPRLDAEVPPLPAPTLAQCTAIMALAFEEVYAREGLAGAEARDLKTLATVLESRQRKALQEQGLSGEESDRRIAEAHDAMLKEAMEAGPGVEKYDLQTCYELARPEPDKHY